MTTAAGSMLEGIWKWLLTVSVSPPWSSGGRSIALLVVWVGAAALARGITDLFLAFQVKKR